MRQLLINIIILVILISLVCYIGGIFATGNFNISEWEVEIRNKIHEIYTIFILFGIVGMIFFMVVFEEY